MISQQIKKSLKMLFDNEISIWEADRLLDSSEDFYLTLPFWPVLKLGRLLLSITTFCQKLLLSKKLGIEISALSALMSAYIAFERRFATNDLSFINEKSMNNSDRKFAINDHSFILYLKQSEKLEELITLYQLGADLNMPPESTIEHYIAQNILDDLQGKFTLQWQAAKVTSRQQVNIQDFHENIQRTIRAAKLFSN